MNSISPEEQRDALLNDAKKEIATLKAMKLLIKADDDCTAVLTISASLSHGFSSSGIFLEVIDKEIKEIQKAIKDKPNKWQ